MTLILYVKVMKILLWVSICNNNYSLTRTVIKTANFIRYIRLNRRNRNRPAQTIFTVSKQRQQQSGWMFNNWMKSCEFMRLLNNVKSKTKINENTSAYRMQWEAIKLRNRQSFTSNWVTDETNALTHTASEAILMFS